MSPRPRREVKARDLPTPCPNSVGPPADNSHERCSTELLPAGPRSTDAREPMIEFPEATGSLRATAAIDFLQRLSATRSGSATAFASASATRKISSHPARHRRRLRNDSAVVSHIRAGVCAHAAAPAGTVGRHVVPGRAVHHHARAPAVLVARGRSRWRRDRHPRATPARSRRRRALLPEVVKRPRPYASPANHGTNCGATRRPTDA